MKKLITENIGLKILSLLIASFLWAYVIITENPTVIRDIRVPLQVTNLDRSSFYIERRLPEIKIKYRAKRKSVLDSTLEQEISALINLTSNREGEHSLKVSANVPAGLEVISFSPSTVKLRIGKMIVKKLAASPHITFNDPDLYLDTLTLKPEKVEIRGKHEFIKQISEAKVFIEVQEKGPFSFNPKIVLLDNEKRAVDSEKLGIMLTPSYITVEYLVLPRPEKQVPVKPHLIGKLPERFTLKEVTVSPETVTVKAPPKELSRISDVPTSVIDLSTLEDSLILKTELLSDSGNISVSPGIATVTIKIVKNPEVTVTVHLVPPAGSEISGGRTVEVTCETGSDINREITIKLNPDDDPIEKIHSAMKEFQAKVLHTSPGKIKIIKAEGK